jgi:hypothetical protein
MAEPLVLPQFCAALRQHVADLGPATYYRYSRGLIPTVLRFVALRPELAAALADDARLLAAPITTTIPSTDAAASNVPNQLDDR